MLTHSIPFSADASADFFAQFPASPAVFALRGADENAEPYASKAANLRRRLQRLLAPPESQSRRLNLRDRVVRIEYELTGSDFESGLLLYRLLRQEFPKTYQKRLRLHHASLIRLNLQNAYPRAYVTNKLGKISAGSLYYGPFQSRTLAEKYMNDSLDLFKIRRCTFELHPDPAFPGCVYSEMKMCLAPCFKGCTDEAYAAEVSRVQAYFDSGGDSLLHELESERDRLSTDLDFEGAAQMHTKVTKIKGILSLCDDICRRLDLLDAVIVQSAADPDTVKLFRFRKGEWCGPETIAVPKKLDEKQKQGKQNEDQQKEEQQTEIASRQETKEETKQDQVHDQNHSHDEDHATEPAISHDDLLRAALHNLEGRAARSSTQFSEELALLKRWYYRTHKTGEIVLAKSDGEISIRKLANAVARVAKGEKPAAELSPKTS